MAFMGRGKKPSISNKNITSIDENIDFNKPGNYFRKRIYYYKWFRSLDDKMQIIVTFIILIAGLIAFLTYKSNIIDPIADIKRMFINSHLIVSGVFLVLVFIINLTSKNESHLIKRLILITVISIIVMMLFWGIKLYLDLTYNEAKFNELYIEQNIAEETEIDVGYTGISLKTEKEHYIDECIKLYNIFRIKSYGTLCMHLLLNILLIYQILKVQKIKNKKEIVNRDDLILFDEEQNVKI